MSLVLWIITVITVLTVLLLFMHYAKVGILKDKKYKSILYSILSVGVVIILLSLFGGPILNKLIAYRDNVLNQSEEECKRNDAPFWCNF